MWMMLTLGWCSPSPFSLEEKRRAEDGCNWEKAAKNDAEEGIGKEGDERGGGQKEGGEAERAQAKLLPFSPSF